MELYNLEEVSNILKIPRRTLYYWLDKRELRGFKMGKHWRVSKKDLEIFLEERANKKGVDI